MSASVPTQATETAIAPPRRRRPGPAPRSELKIDETRRLGTEQTHQDENDRVRHPLCPARQPSPEDRAVRPQRERVWRASEGEQRDRRDRKRTGHHPRRDEAPEERERDLETPSAEEHPAERDQVERHHAPEPGRRPRRPVGA